MNTKEMKETDGGCHWCAIAALVLAVVNTDWDKAGADIKRGWNSL